MRQKACLAFARYIEDKSQSLLIGEKRKLSEKAFIYVVLRQHCIATVHMVRRAILCFCLDGHSCVLEIGSVK